jgi:4'-phosphopantetheinyl transferase
VTSGTIHLWTIDLDAPARVPSFLGTLSGEERERADRFKTTELRLRFIVAHGATRNILARYAGADPAALRFERTAFGKPFVAGGTLSFNLSHSDGLAVCAVAAEGQLGVDVERFRPIADADAIVNRFFAEGEVRRYAGLDESDREAAFFSTWTRKEAFVKAIGDGLQCPLGSFEVDIAPSAAEPWITLEEGRGAWHLRSFEPAAGYAGAVAWDRPIAVLERFTYGEAEPRTAVHGPASLQG